MPGLATETKRLLWAWRLPNTAQRGPGSQSVPSGKDLSRTEQDGTEKSCEPSEDSGGNLEAGRHPGQLSSRLEPLTQAELNIQVDGPIGRKELENYLLQLPLLLRLGFTAQAVVTSSSTSPSWLFFTISS